MRRDPYCGHCGYSLIGLTESSKCPECGKPIVDVLTRDPVGAGRGRRYKSATTIFGLPLIHIAQGPHEDEPYGKARGIIAIGDVAIGGLAIGNRLAVGIIALGGRFAIGVVALAGLACGLLAVGGLAVGGLALGGGAVGGLAYGGGAAGYVALGGGAAGYYAAGGGVAGAHVLGPMVRDAVAVQFFKDWRWLLGPWPPTGPCWNLLAVMFVGALLVALLTAAIVLLGYLVTGRRRTEDQSA